MTGWELLETLAEMADKEPDKLDAIVYALWNRNISQTIAFRPQKIEYRFDSNSKDQGIFLTLKGE